jgi:signal transduction histidine kinase
MIAFTNQCPLSQELVQDGSVATSVPNASMRRLAASLAHNVNNALTGVIGHLELALAEASSDSTLERHLDGSLRAACQIADIVRRIVNYAFRPVTPPLRELLSLWWVTSVAVGRMDPEAKRLGISLSLEGQSSGWIRGNARLLQAALDHLLANALEAMPHGGRLTLRLWEEAGQIGLSLSDTGPGLPEEARERLFEPFFTTKSCGHLGLGLVLCREMVEALDGSIQVASANGQGTTLTLRFPAVTAPNGDAETGIPRQDVKQCYPPPHLALTS